MISLGELLKGLSTLHPIISIDSCCKGSLIEKHKIFFNLYDMGDKGYITKVEFTKMVFDILRNQLVNELSKGSY